MSIRPLESRDIESILAIQTASPEIAQWKSSDYERVTQGEMLGWVFESNLELTGFLVGRLVGTEFEILNFAVNFNARRQGTGAALLDAALNYALSLAAETAILEVRSTNQPALNFYTHHNFQIAGRRRNYYNAPPDDALLLTLPLTLSLK
ncbi:MAG TPA: GNAT family N-acetyltransferase [Candidatus Acidoferrales bacterium]